MKSDQIEEYLSDLEDKLLNKSKHFRIRITRDWTKQFPKQAAVYLFRENGKVCYIGETGNFYGRMGDILNTYHHTLRRNLGHYHFKNHPLYEKASSRKKYAPEIELLLNELIETNLTMSFILTDLGRKELEERLFEKLKPKYNLKGKRGSHLSKNL
ncbi:GIY-YIG nuclease family protein [Tenacibaculum sp. ZS6-P6]|uniref:GIY-YIG nuclease family protein n=1 Tax=Tenacibaculum sp. ZS6-P6 TaxID=3447503 RepID=UPI003F9472F6